MKPQFPTAYPTFSKLRASHIWIVLEALFYFISTDVACIHAQLSQPPVALRASSLLAARGAALNLSRPRKEEKGKKKKKGTGSWLVITFLILPSWVSLLHLFFWSFLLSSVSPPSLPSIPTPLSEDGRSLTRPTPAGSLFLSPFLFTTSSSRGAVHCVRVVFSLHCLAQDQI